MGSSREQDGELHVVVVKLWSSTFILYRLEMVMLVGVVCFYLVIVTVC